MRSLASVVSVLGGFLGEIDEAQAIITPPGSPSFATTFQRAASTATKQVVRLDIRSNLGFQKFVALGDVGDVSFDGATGLTPWVSDATFMQANSSFTLTTTPGGSAPVNGAFAQLGISRKSGFISRQVVGPSFAGLRLPILPTPQAEFNVVAADSAFINGAGIISSPGGYDALRPRYFTTDSSEEFFAGAPNINAQLCVSLFFNKR